MTKVAVLMAEGFEESETITIVDILRRAGITCHTFGFHDGLILGMQKMKIKADQIFSEKIKEYDMLVLPGGRPGGDNLRTNPEVIAMVQYFNDHQKYLAAMCSGTLVLKEAGAIEGKKMTGYTGYENKLTGAIFLDDVVVVDDKMVTSQGPATPYPFAFKIAEVLGKDVSELKERMLYNFAGGK